MARRRLSVRFPEELADRLERAAAADRRSVNSYLVVLLERELPPLLDQTELPFPVAR